MIFLNVIKFAHVLHYFSVLDKILLDSELTPFGILLGVTWISSNAVWDHPYSAYAQRVEWLDLDFAYECVRGVSTNLYYSLCNN